MTATRSGTTAAKAFECVTARAEAKGNRSKEYKALANALPGMILQNGLAQATGFLLAKGDCAHNALLEDLSTVMAAAGTAAAPDGQRLHERIINSDVGEIMRLTRHALEASAWLKRYAQSLLHENEGRQ